MNYGMLCQNCKKNEATKTFIVNWLGGQQEVHLCQECLERMWKYAGSVGQREAFTAMSGWWPGKADPRDLGNNHFPGDAGKELKMKRRLAALRARLDEAARQEDYEEAARLRDSIAAMEQEV